MKKNILKLTVLLLIMLTGTVVMAQSYKQTLNDLKGELKNSIFQSEFTLSEDGTITRTDNNGNTFVFNIKDVDTFVAVNDGLHNVIITLKTGKKAVNTVNGTKNESDVNVFSFTNNTESKKTLDYFKKLKKEFV